MKTLTLSPDRWLPTGLFLSGTSLLRVHLLCGLAVIGTAAGITAFLWARGQAARPPLPAIGHVESERTGVEVSATLRDREDTRTLHRRDWRVDLTESDLWLRPGRMGLDLANLTFATDREYVRVPRLDVVEAFPVGSRSLRLRYLTEGRVQEVVLDHVTDALGLARLLGYETGHRHGVEG